MLKIGSTRLGDEKGPLILGSSCGRVLYFSHYNTFLEVSLHWKIIETAVLLYINRREESPMSRQKINCRSILKEEMSS